MPLFLVQHRVERPAGSDVARMHRALTYAVERLTRAGTSIHLLGAVFVPDEVRCLYLMAATDATGVEAAADMAGLVIEPVRRVIPLSEKSRRT
jgi:hypothetical protein